MEAVGMLTQEGEERRQGALAVLGRLCEQDATLADATAHIVQTARSQWRDDGSSSPALEEAAQRLLARLETPLVDESAR